MTVGWQNQLRCDSGADCKRIPGSPMSAARAGKYPEDAAAAQLRVSSPLGFFPERETCQDRIPSLWRCIQVASASEIASPAKQGQHIAVSRRVSSVQTHDRSDADHPRYVMIAHSSRYDIDPDGPALASRITLYFSANSLLFSSTRRRSLTVGS